MNYLIAPNALKGSLSAIQASHIIESAIYAVSPDSKCLLCPIADGGNGTVQCLVQATGGTIQREMVTGPLPSMSVDAQWGILGDGKTAVIEMAEAAGLHLLKPTEYDVLQTTTIGVGELLEIILDKGFRSIIIGLGGSATNDGGMGFASAIGIKFYDRNDRSLSPRSESLSHLAFIDASGCDPRIAECNITVLSDVTNVLYGPKGTSHIFGKQKGASPEIIRLLDDGLQNYAAIIKDQLKIDVANITGSGAAGGLGAALLAFCSAEIVSGSDFVLNTVGFDAILESCNCVITTEGTIDEQTKFGKGIAGIAGRAQRLKKPVCAFVGKIEGNAEHLKRQIGLRLLCQISPDTISFERAMLEAKEWLVKAISENISVMEKI
jgi:glycerate 2-kinase